MTHNQTPRLQAVTQQEEPILIAGMVGIVNEAGTFIEERRLRFLERYTVPYLIGVGFTWIP